MGANLENIDQSIKALGTTEIVSCPLLPIAIPGIGAGAEGALDAMGKQFVVKVPKHGEIRSATYFDLDVEGTQVNFYIFNKKVTEIADNAAWTLSVGDAPYFITKLAFVIFDAQTAVNTSELTNIGKAYTAPFGKFWIQAQCVAICTIAVAPKLQLQIQSFDTDFKEG